MIFLDCKNNVFDNQVMRKAKIRNRYNQASNSTRDTTWESDKNVQEHITHKIAKRPTLSQQVITRLQGKDKLAHKDKQNTIITFSIARNVNVLVLASGNAILLRRFNPQFSLTISTRCGE